MKKYQDALQASVRAQLESWLESTDASTPRDEVYRFLHTVSGTSGTIGMAGLSETARSLMDELRPEGGASYPVDELRRFLLPLAAAAFGEDEGILADAAPAAEQPFVSIQEGEQPVVLLLDDDATFLVFVKDQLESRGYMVLAATTPAQAIDYLHDYRPDSLVFNLLMKDGSGFDLILALRDKLRRQFIPTTIVSADNRTETRIEAYRLGADDFVAKPLHMPEFLAVLERQRMRKQLFERLLRHDELTGALKRNLAEETFQDIRKASETSGSTLTVAKLDVDGLRAINQRYGPRAGDQVLEAVVQHLRETLPDRYPIVRSGGDSFLLFLPDMNERQAKMELEQAASAFAAMEFEDGGTAFRASWSAGVVEAADPEQPAPYWFDKARVSLRAAKEAGGKSVRANTVQDEKSALIPLRIAIVDDDPIVRSMLSEYTAICFPEQAKLDIRAYRDGETFLADEWTRSDERYFVILDRMMPRMDGLEVLQRLRGFGKPGQYTVLMLTGKKGEADVVKALQLGADDYMTKPFSIRELEARIRKLARRVG